MTGRDFRSPVHAFVDENKSKGLLVCVAVIESNAVTDARAAMRSLVHKGSRRIHMTRESPVHRKTVLAGIADLAVAVELYTSGSDRAWQELEARGACLTQIVRDLACRRCAHLTIELDESLAQHDRRVLYRATKVDGQHSMDYRLLPAANEPLLWIPDAIAWSWARGGEWKKAVAPLVRRVHDL